MLARFIRRQYDWLKEEPKIQAGDYATSKIWYEEFIRKHLSENEINADDALADMVYEHAMTELEDCTKAFESLSSKANDLIKLKMTIVAAFLALWRYAVSADKAGQLVDAAHRINYMLLLSNLIAGFAIACFVIGMMILATCLRGMPYMPPPTVKNLLDWYADKANARYIKVRTAARLHQVNAGNRTANAWIHNRLDIAWYWAIVGITVLAISIACRLAA